MNADLVDKYSLFLIILFLFVYNLTQLLFCYWVWPSLPCLCVFPGLSQEKIAAFAQRMRAEPRYLLAQNVSTCIDPLEVCLHRQTVQETMHTFQHSIPTEGKPVTNQKNSGVSHSRKMEIVRIYGKHRRRSFMNGTQNENKLLRNPQTNQLFLEFVSLKNLILTK